jgi:hypothetical protein
MRVTLWGDVDSQACPLVELRVTDALRVTSLRGRPCVVLLPRRRFQETLASRGNLVEVCAPKGALREGRPSPGTGPREGKLPHCRSWAFHHGLVVGGSWYPGCHHTDNCPRRLACKHLEGEGVGDLKSWWGLIDETWQGTSTGPIVGVTMDTIVGTFTVAVGFNNRSIDSLVLVAAPRALIVEPVSEQ